MHSANTLHSNFWNLSTFILVLMYTPILPVIFSEERVLKKLLWGVLIFLAPIALVAAEVFFSVVVVQDVVALLWLTVIVVPFCALLPWLLFLSFSKRRYEPRARQNRANVQVTSVRS